MAQGNVTYAVDFVAQIARLEQGTRAGARHVKRMADEMEGAANLARRAILGIAGALGVFSFSAAIKSAFEAGDAAAKMGDRFGIATQKLIGMQHAGDLAGLSGEALAVAMRGQANAAVDAARGSEAQARAFATLNLNAAEFVKLPMDRQFSILIDRLRQLENASLRNATAQDIFGKSAGEVMGLVAEGSEAIEKATADTEAWGLAISRVDAAKLEIANDAMTRAQAAAKGLFTTIAVNLAPAVAALGRGFANTAAEARGWREEVESGTEEVVTAVAYAADVIQGLRFAYAAVKLAVADLLVVGSYSFAKLAEGAMAVGEALSWTGPVARLGWLAIRDDAQNVTTQLGLFAESAIARRQELQDEFDAIALQGLPAEAIMARFREAREAMQQEAEQLAASREKLMGAATGAGVEPDGKKAPTGKDWREQLAQRVERLMVENFTELELNQQHLEDKQTLLDSAHAAGLITEEEYQRNSTLIVDKYHKEKTRIEDEEIKKRFGIAQVYRQLDLQSAAAIAGQMAGMMNSKSRAMFEVGKAGAIAEAVINTYTAATGAFKALAGIPIIGPALGAAAAAAAVVAGMANVSRIRATQFGGGAAAAPVFAANPVTGVPAGSVGSSTVQLPAAPAAAPRTQIDVTIINERVDDRVDVKEVVEKWFPALQEAVSLGADLRLRLT